MLKHRMCELPDLYDWTTFISYKAIERFTLKSTWSLMLINKCLIYFHTLLPRRLVSVFPSIMFIANKDEITLSANVDEHMI